MHERFCVSARNHFSVSVRFRICVRVCVSCVCVNGNEGTRNLFNLNGRVESVNRIHTFVEFALVRPRLRHDISKITFIYRVNSLSYRQNPAYAVYCEQSRTALLRTCPKYRIPLAKAVKTAEWQFGVDERDLNYASPAKLRKLALARQIRQTTNPKGKEKQPSYAKVCSLRPVPASYIMWEQRPIAVLRARLRFNRHHLRDHQHLLGLEDAPWCLSCLSGFSMPHRATAKHALFDCPQFEVARTALYHELQCLGVPMTFDVITGGCSGVPANRVADVCASTATFLRRVDRGLHI